MAGFDGELGVRQDYSQEAYDLQNAGEVQQRFWQSVRSDQQGGWPVNRQGLYQGDYWHRAGIGFQPPHQPAPPYVEQPVPMLPGQYNGPTKMYHGHLYGLDQYGSWFRVQEVLPPQENQGQLYEGYPPGRSITRSDQPSMSDPGVGWRSFQAGPQFQEPQIDLPTLELDTPAQENVRSHYPINSREAQVYNQSRDGIVKIEAIANGRLAGGSGFFLTSTGELATDYHVIAGSNPEDLRVVTADGKKYSVTIEAIDKGNDLALLKVKSAPNDRFIPLPLGNSRLQPGEGLMTVGHPQSWDEVYTSPGHFMQPFYVQPGALCDEMKSEGLYKPNRTFLLSNMHTEPGDCGSPVINSQGLVVGLHEWGLQERFAGATPVEALEQMIDWYHRRPSPGWTAAGGPKAEF